MPLNVYSVDEINEKMNILAAHLDARDKQIQEQILALQPEPDPESEPK